MSDGDIPSSVNNDTLENSITELELKDNAAAYEMPDFDDVDISQIPAVSSLRVDSASADNEKLLGYIELYQSKIEAWQALAVQLEEQNKAQLGSKHRGSVIEVHNRMFKTLINTESQQQQEIARLKERILELETDVKRSQLLAQESEAVSNGNGDSFTSSQLQSLLDENGELQKKVLSLEAHMKELKSQLQIEKMKHEKTSDSHRKSISTLHTNMFKKLLDAEDDFEDKMDKLNEELAKTQRQLQQERARNDQSDKLRRDSVRTVHNNMLSKLLDAQAEHDEEKEAFGAEIKDLKAALRKEILQKNATQERAADAASGTAHGDAEDDAESDMSDLETEKIAESKPFDELWQDAEDEPEAEVTRLKSYVEQLERELKAEREQNKKIEKQRTDSIHNLHNNMFQKLLDAEFEYEEEIERLHREKDEMNEKIAFYEETFQKMNVTGSGNDASAAVGRLESGLGGGEVARLQGELKEKLEVIEQCEQRIAQLTQDTEQLEVKVENEQKQRRGSVSFLSKQMMAKLLEAEEESEEQRAQFKMKLQRLQEELQESKEMSFKMEKTRKNSVTKVSQSMFHKLLVAEQTKKQLEQTYQDRVKELEKQLAVERLKNQTESSKQEMIAMDANKAQEHAKLLEQEIEEIKEHSQVQERQRRESISQLKNSYWAKLLDAEDTHKEQIKKLKAEVTRLLDLTDMLTQSKLHLINQCNEQLNQLRQAVTIYNKNASSSWF